MLQLPILLLAAVLASWALLNVVPAKSVVTWKLAILASEYGHYLGMVSAFLGWHVLVSIGASDAGSAEISASVVALLLTVFACAAFLRPLISARRVAAALPRQLETAFGGPDRTWPVLSTWRLLLPPVRRSIPVETHVFAREGTPDELRLDFYQPATSTPAPCIVLIHGGGWDAGDQTQLSGWNRYLARSGYAVAAITYRLAPQHRWPAQRDDTLAAIAWLKTHAPTLGIDPERFILFGRSAGGQIATAVGYSAGDPAIRGIIALYAPHDLHFVWSIAREDDVLNSVKLLRQYLGGPPDPDRRAAYDSASGQHFVESQPPHALPPTLLLHGTLDELVWVRHSQRLAGRLAEAGVPHVFVELPWATHAFDFNQDGPAGQVTEFALKSFLTAVTADRQILRPSKP
jgi:acetyl esterase/lipase